MMIPGGVVCPSLFMEVILAFVLELPVDTLSPLRQAKGKQADNKAQISFTTDAHMMIPALVSLAFSVVPQCHLFRHPICHNQSVSREDI